MVNITITVTGLEEVKDLLGNRTPKAILAAVKEQKRATGEAIVNAARGDAAVDTGEMRDGISISSETPEEIEVTAAADHSSYVDEGTIHMAAQPFFRGNAERIMSSFYKDLENAIFRKLPLR
jgi:HK97 gp10 family phage protein